MYCPDCGYLNRPGAKYCRSCRIPLGVSTPAWRGPLQTGELMDNGRYRITRPLGKGGMGAVYLAENLQAFGREVVIKEMLDYFDPANPEEVDRARQRFEDEARILAELKHPAVPDIYGYFSQGGRNYLVMEFIVGENLETGVTHRDGQGALVPALPYSPEQIIHFGAQLCDLLEYLAGRKDPVTNQPRPVIHRDIKPANILRDPETDRVWLVDFGTAKARFDLNKGLPDQDEADEQPTSDKDSVYGTVGYAPPEQYAGEATPASDVYALAATLYHLFTDDDPRDHPFEFQELEDLPLRVRLALRNVLEHETDSRSTAAELRAALVGAMPEQPTAETQPLIFPDGKVARQLKDIPQLALEHWDYTRDILYSGDLDHWLRRSLHNPVVAETARRIVDTNADQDAGLQAFVRELDPKSPSSQLQLTQNTLDLGTATAAHGGSAVVSIANRGQGYGNGTISSSAAWLQGENASFGVKPGGTADLVITADTATLTPGKRYEETVTLTPADGNKPLTLRVRVAVAEPRVTVSPQRLVFDVTTTSVAPLQLTLTNTGGDRVECNFMRDEQWLLIQPKTLTLPAGQSATVDVAIREQRLPPVVRPSTDLTMRPSHGEPAVIPVTVITGRSNLLRVFAILMLIVAGGLLLWGAVRLFGGDRLDALLARATPTVPAPDAAQLDAEMVRVDGFEIDRYEVTNLQYRRFDSTHDFEEGQDLFPVVDVTWEDARLYCDRVGKRLPSLDEWRQTAQGDEGWTYPWGNEFDHARLNSADNRATRGLMPFRSFPAGATPSGVHNLLGNASEWVVGDADHRQTHAGGSWYDSGLFNGTAFWQTLDQARTWHRRIPLPAVHHRRPCALAGYAPALSFNPTDSPWRHLDRRLVQYPCALFTRLSSGRPSR